MTPPHRLIADNPQRASDADRRAVAVARLVYDDYLLKFPYDRNGAGEVSYRAFRRAGGSAGVRLPWTEAGE